MRRCSHCTNRSCCANSSEQKLQALSSSVPMSGLSLALVPAPQRQSTGMELVKRSQTKLYPPSPLKLQQGTGEELTCCLFRPHNIIQHVVFPVELASLVYTSQLFSFQQVLLLISSDIIQRKHTENTYISSLNTPFSPVEKGLWASALTSFMVQRTLPLAGKSRNLVVFQEYTTFSLTLRDSILLFPNGVSSSLVSQTSL